MSTINIKLDDDGLKRVKLAAKFSKQTVGEFAADWLMAGVRACEDDYIMHEGVVVGDRREIEELGREVLRRPATETI